MLSRAGFKDNIPSESRESMSPREVHMLSRGGNGRTSLKADRESMAHLLGEREGEAQPRTPKASGTPISMLLLTRTPAYGDNPFPLKAFI